MRIILFLYILLSAETVIAELFKPNPNLEPHEVISFQLNALKDNNIRFNFSNKHESKKELV